MYEICVQQMRSAIEEAQRGAPPRRAGNTDPGIWHQDVYPARGEDRWVAVALHSRDEQLRLEALCGGAAVARWTREREDHEIVATLQRAGLAAGVLQDIEDLLERDPVLAARGALVTLPHPKLGAFGHVRTPISFSGHALEPFRAPGLGEHVREIACGIAGITPQRLAALIETGVMQ
jgi:crotonobetainyl-CoA:carnitine CoA-transferase CaiB-like acyl-CoA transferase